MATKTSKPETTPVIPTYFYGTGRRKSAISQVRIYPGSGKILINDRETSLDLQLQKLLTAIGQLNQIDISAHVHGGGVAGQILAIRLGIARALVQSNPELRATLRKEGYLTRDPRERERKKYGLHAARRAPQFSKR